MVMFVHCGHHFPRGVPGGSAQWGVSIWLEAIPTAVSSVGTQGSPREPENASTTPELSTPQPVPPHTQPQRPQTGGTCD